MQFYNMHIFLRLKGFLVAKDQKITLAKWKIVSFLMILKTLLNVKADKFDSACVMTESKTILRSMTIFFIYLSIYLSIYRGAGGW